jgi:uncharacterized protein (DUF362 family)/NAD-dependent dihydropyrimidine dehydrogenase PreA subunit
LILIKILQLLDSIIVKTDKENKVQNMSKPLVSISKCSSYEQSTVRAALGDLLAPLGGMESFVKPADNVLLKINLLRASAPDQAVTTHPEIIRAVIEKVREAGGIPIVGDSPGGPNKPRMLKNIIATTGIGKMCEETGTELVIFDHDTTTIKVPEGKLYTSFSAGKAVVNADVVITMPKLKTHGFMKFTGAVKVLFGVIPGMEKMQYHLKVPDRFDFADMLLDLYLAVKPTLSIMDAVVGMEGEGPSGGNPKYIGALMASRDSIALDFAASKIIGFNPLEVYTNLAAHRRAMISLMEGKHSDNPSFEDFDIDIAGTPVVELLVSDFTPPEKDLAEKTPAILFGLLKNLVTAKPFLATPGPCTGCGLCRASCPASAISYRDSKPIFDYNLCIRCYCCEELCQELAIKRKNHPLVKPFIR